MSVKKIGAALLFIIVWFMDTGCFLESEKRTLNENFLSYEEIADIYFENRGLINDIKEILFSSGFVPDDGFTPSGFKANLEKSIYLCYRNGRFVCENDPNGEKLQIFGSIQDDILDFLRVNEDLKPSIGYRVIYGCAAIEFDFLDKTTYTRAGIIYTTAPKTTWGEVHLEDNWYAYRYLVP